MAASEQEHKIHEEIGPLLPPAAEAPILQAGAVRNAALYDSAEAA